MTKADKEAAIAAKRGPLDHELYSAELDLKTAEASGSEQLVEEPKQRVERIKGQLKVLDDEEKAL
jgi:beta-glucosidase-like glycosyl hydrolase